MHATVPVRFGRGRLDSLVPKGLTAYLIAVDFGLRAPVERASARFAIRLARVDRCDEWLSVLAKSVQQFTFGHAFRMSEKDMVFERTLSEMRLIPGRAILIVYTGGAENRA